MLAPSLARWLGGDAARLRPLRGLGAALLGAAALLHGLNGWVGMTGGLDPTELAAVLLGTGYGRSVLAFSAASLLLLLTRWAWPLVVLCAVWLGHGAGQGELSGWVALHGAHLASLALWLAGLCALAADPSLDARRFSALALPLVALLVGTGAGLAWLHVDELRSAYAALLAAKLALAAVTWTLALVNRWRLRAGRDLSLGVQLELLAALSTAMLGALLSQVQLP